MRPISAAAIVLASIIAFSAPTHAQNVSWMQTPASGMQDVAVGSDERLWLVGSNGTIWFSNDRGRTFTQTDAKGFSRVATAPNGDVWAVGRSGLLWKRVGSDWIRTSASGMADVAVGRNGAVYLAGHNGSIWLSVNGDDRFVHVRDGNFRRVSVDAYGTLWAITVDGHLWKYDGSVWTQTGATGMGDVGASLLGRNIMLAGTNGSIWFTYDGVKFTRDEKASGFRSVAVGGAQTWGVGFNGTVWERYVSPPVK